MSKDRLSSLEKKIIELLKSYPDASIPTPLLLDALSLKNKKGGKKLKTAINRLKQLGHIRVSKGNLVRLNEAVESDKNIYVGKLDVTSHGDGYVIVEGRDQDIKISRRYLGTALNGDKVKVRLTGYHRKNNKPLGRIEEIVSRANTTFVGKLKEEAKNTFLIEADMQSSRVDFFVDPKDLNGAKPGEKVSFKLVQWEDVRGYPQAAITASLGKAGSNEANVLSILAEKQFAPQFPREVEAFAENIPEVITEEEIGRRRDMREEVVLTIDPADAKDFDDGLSIEMLDNGNYYLGVHIADVTHYMPVATVLDEEAFERGTSVYLVDRVIPMMPEKLSNGVCSLRPHEDKLAYSCFMEIAPNGKLENYTIEETVIHSKQRFVYDEVQEILDGKADHKFKKELQILEKLAKTLLDKRFKEGSINFETPEPKFVLDDEGRPIDVIVKERLFAHKLIEECMLMANKTVSLYIDTLRTKVRGKKSEKNDHPFLYRVHGQPDLEKLHNIKETASPLGINFELDGVVSASKINKLLKQVEGTSVENIINGLMLRSMAKAEYSPKNIGHFGLGFSHYAHFTSPIRRYPDVIVHRLLKRYHSGANEYTFDQLVEIGAHCSERERFAVEAERDSVKLKQVEYLSERLGQTFDGTISGVTENGIYVQINDIYCEGMIRVSDLKDDYYVYHPKLHCLTGRSKGKQFRLGDSIKVKVVRTDLDRRQIDLELSAH
ncbi:MAG: ribonuclease R [Balneolaceae bacterium]|nr:ribonuclease R [Balneolaceae bacterium]MCH8547521.1 ribonuclease R [Balneolaceae bacterium]